MNATPAICPACGELVVALFLSGDDPRPTLPEHDDRAFPWMTCAASDRADLLTFQWSNPE